MSWPKVPGLPLPAIVPRRKWENRQITKVRSSATIDWQHRESARAKIRILVRRILRRYGYPPDLQAEATKLVLEQAEVMCSDWAV